ncbi:MAG: exodeoxyribonuclease VII small subunit [Gammaproteobacteria bacterium]|nr:exodeoxyribonuclease VII small subunit [Gammaproteobacteria bacterium]MDH5728156.1 exodeoxyribonuclease VII small subunit [Gammaproteobacteria bacterium]
MAKKASKTPDFESSLQELEAIVNRMEKGDSSLETALADFERGISLTRQCQSLLQQAEQRVKILVEKDGEQLLQPFDEPEQDE